MVNDNYEKTKQALIYSKKRIEKAGRSIRKGEPNQEECIEIIQNYRAAHQYPLQIIKNLVWKHIQKQKLPATIVRRLKRLPTIIDKLKRSSLDGKTDNAMCITRMHDIGGCRVIVESLAELNKLNRSLDSSHSAHSFKIYDYIIHPKPTGYRGIHRVYKTYENKQGHQWKGFRIEVQLRTKLQHIWATTVEVVDIIEKETLKTNPQAANDQWKRLFFIMSEFLAVKDGAAQITTEQEEEYKTELFALNRQLNAYHKLDAFQQTFKMDEIKGYAKKGAYTLLIFDNETGNGGAIIYSSKEKKEALARYASFEKNDKLNALLVAGDDIKSIEKAYPNYIIDTSEFLQEFSRITLS